MLSTTAPENINYARKIRIYPDLQQKQLLAKCFGTSRFLYNCALNLVQETQTTKNDIIWSLPWFRQRLIPKEKDLPKELLWLKEVPYDTRALAIRDVIYAFKSNFQLLKKGLITKFQVKPRSARGTQMCHVDHRALKPDLRLFTRRLKKKLRVRKKTQKWWKAHIKEINRESLIIKENGRYYLILPLNKEVDTSLKTRKPIVTLDPGVRTFQSFYSPDGICGKIGDGTSLKLNRLGTRIDKLTSLASAASNKRIRKNLKDRWRVLRTKIRNTIRDLHWKTASYLCRNWQLIVISDFQVQQMIPKRLRKIRSKTVRQMLSLSHYAFRQRLLFKAESLGCQVSIWNEAYTTKTCGNCGGIQEMGGKRSYDCKKCNVISDRDIGAARTFLIRFLTETVCT